MNKLKLLSLFCVLLLLAACKKTYEDGPLISLRSKMNRLTGKWKLVEFSSSDLYGDKPEMNPEIDKYIEFTKDELSPGVYLVNFTNFQHYYYVPLQGRSEKLHTTTGTWEFNKGPFPCGVGYTGEKEGLKIDLDFVSDTTAMDWWKITRLTNKELKMSSVGCPNFGPYLDNGKTLTFEKVK